MEESKHPPIYNLSTFQTIACYKTVPTPYKLHLSLIHIYIEIAFDFIKQAVQIAPVYFVTGNHEANFSHYDQFKTGLEASGVDVYKRQGL